MQGGFGKATIRTSHRPREPSAAAQPPSPKVPSLTATSSGDLEVTVDFLTEVDKLVQLIECPIFTCKEETPGGCSPPRASIAGGSRRTSK